MPIIDFAKVHTAGGRAELMPQMRDAMHTYGFVRVVNHGLTQAQVSVLHLLRRPSRLGPEHSPLWLP